VLGACALVAGACTPKDSEGAGTERDEPGRPTLALTELPVVAVDDVQQFWIDALPSTYQLDYESIPDDRLYPYSQEQLPPPCGDDDITWELMAGNAFYCPLGDFVAWDEQELVPMLAEDYGQFGVALVIAHEWGHAIQDRAGTEGPTILIEQQADCFAGAWTSHELDDPNPALDLRAEDLDSAIAGMLFLRDQPGTSLADPSAHGSGFDRISAFQDGFEEGPARCAAYDASPPELLDFEFASEDEFDSGGNLPYEEVVEVAALDLNDYWAELTPSFQPVEQIVPYVLDGDLPVCEGSTLGRNEADWRIRFCFDENTVVWDEALLVAVQDDIGDFGVAVLLSVRWAEAAQKQIGQEEAFIASRVGELQQSCFTGAWARRAADGRSEQWTLSPGDLDEALQAFLAFGQIDAEAGARAGAFERVQSFRLGYVDGPEICDDLAGVGS
jgi:predicted metalloprotease